MNTTLPAQSPADEFSAYLASEITRLFPANPCCTEQEYLAVDTNLLVEFIDGYIQVLPVPTEKHQAILAYLFEALLTFTRPSLLGKVLFSAFRIKLRNGLYREPDLVFIKTENYAQRQNEFWRWADLVMEIVSPDNRSHDLITKRREYALVGIPEYWIVDPKLQEISVLKLVGDRYEGAGVYHRGEAAKSVLLPGFSVDVAAVFDAN